MAFDLEILQNGVKVAEWLDNTLPNDWTTFEFDIAPEDAAIFADFTAIQILVRATGLGGTEVRVTWVEVEIPGRSVVLSAMAGVPSVQGGNVQLLRPDQNIAGAGIWFVVGFLNFWATLDEVTPDDATTYSYTLTENGVLRVGLTNGTDPGIHDGFKVRVRAMQTSGA